MGVGRLVGVLKEDLMVGKVLSLRFVVTCWRRNLFALVNTQLDALKAGFG